MRLKVNRFSDELKFRVVQEYLSTDVSGKELKQKYNIKGNNCINNWIRKFGLETPSNQEIELQSTMAKQKEKTPYEQELESRVSKLEQQLGKEQLRTLALDTLIDIAERDLKIPIRKKPGAKQ